MKDKVAQEEIQLEYVPTRETIANSLAKPIKTEVFKRHTCALGLPNCKEHFFWDFVMIQYFINKNSLYYFQIVVLISPFCNT